jgi:hypothetical protein
MINLYQISKLNGKYWWTSTIRIMEYELENYKEDSNYLWTTDKKIAEELSGKNI